MEKHRSCGGATTTSEAIQIQIFYEIRRAIPISQQAQKNFGERPFSIYYDCAIGVNRVELLKSSTDALANLLLVARIARSSLSNLLSIVRWLVTWCRKAFIPLSPLSLW